jgi:hypothetical protein
MDVGQLREQEEPASMTRPYAKGVYPRGPLMVSPSGLELRTHQENHAARALYEKQGFVAVGFGLSPPPESAPDVEYHWRPSNLGLQPTAFGRG